MTDKAKNRSFHQAKNSKQDEFYTELSDIEKELNHYKQHFRGKVVYCNCDDPRVSNFFHYFSYNFEKLGLKKLITTCFKNQDMSQFSRNNSEQAIYLEYNGDKNGNNVPDLDEIGIKYLKGDGDFRSEESIELLKLADIVVTNPPFSLFREYVAQLIEHDKKFVIVGNQNAITYKEISDLIAKSKIWLGNKSGDMAFRVPDYYEPRETRYWEDPDGQKWRSMGNACWFTNLDISKRHEELILYKRYSPEEYPTYANYHAIEVGKTKDIPMDYEGHMGVPVTFLDKHNLDQFEIIGSSRTLGKPMSEIAEKGTYSQGGPRFYLKNNDGTYRRLYDRLVIRNKNVKSLSL
tara:strand:- start:3216 stop:4259 length:1044 start_codon:yes stop_codon:yes gene_type:complete